jgi:glyoxylase-like metal-dependent hydrolase (beta-lactamase superfamily II)
MRRLADDLWLITGLPPYAINAYLAGDVLVDAMSRHAARRILRELEGHPVAAHALTHAHPDHQGASHAVCEALGLPLWVGEADVAAAEDPALIRARQPRHPINTIIAKTLTGPAHPVARALREDDEVGGFRVLDVPGHCAGHVALWREADRVLILGDVLNNQNPLTGVPGLREPLGFFTPDPERNRESIRRVGELEPALVCFGHGRPLRDTRRFVEFCRSV